MELKITNFEDRHLKDYLIIVSNIKEMSHSKFELTLNKLRNVKSYREKEDVMRILIENNLKLVVSTACRYRGAGLSFARLIKAGNSGLVRAVRKWDGAENFFQFITWNAEGAIIDELIRERKALVHKKR